MLTKEFESELKKWRHDFHASPELNFDVNQTCLLYTSDAADE